ncbi:MAG: MFS transporter, partial [Saprospiraceae bacterium]
MLSRRVWILSLISLFTDTASEMLYPVMPIYLKTIGFSIVLIGVLEGMAEAIAGLSKGYFGKLSDYWGQRAVFVQTGYGLSSLSKPMLALSALPWWIFFARTVDRIGKGIRTGARDAMLSDEATPATKGRVFGFHRSMDTLGAVAGPVLALLYLHFRPGDYRHLFLIAFLPGLLALATSFLLKDKSRTPATQQPPPPVFSFLNYWKKSPPLYRKVVLGLLVFALVNSSDVFLLLKIKQAGGSDTQVIGVYIFYNLVYAACAFPIGILADRLGLRRVFLSGLLLFALVYFGMAIGGSIFFYAGLFLLYGLYA